MVTPTTTTTTPPRKVRGHGHTHHRDHNLRAAYLHVLADALTSVLAIGALMAGRTFGWTWMDPVMGIVGGADIARWSWSLLADTARVLLDGEVSDERRLAIVRAVELDQQARVVDFHVWRVGPRHLAAIVSVISESPREPGHYRALLEAFDDLVHVTVEVQSARKRPRPEANGPHPLLAAIAMHEGFESGAASSTTGSSERATSWMKFS